jgi:hypothetical protein
MELTTCLVTECIAKEMTSVLFLTVPCLIITLCFSVGLGPEWKRIGRMELTTCLVTECIAKEMTSCARSRCTYSRLIESRVRAGFHRPVGGEELSFEGPAQTYRCVAKKASAANATLDFDHCPALNATVPCYADDGPSHSGFTDQHQPRVYFERRLNRKVVSVSVTFLVLGFIILVPALVAAVLFGCMK